MNSTALKREIGLVGAGVYALIGKAAGQACILLSLVNFWG